MVTTRQRKRVLLIGIDPALVNIRPSSPRTVDSIRAAGRGVDARLAELGYEARTCIVDRGETAEAILLEALDGQDYDCVMIGAGVRGLMEHTPLFETVVNLVHTRLPRATFCFNSHPGDTVDAVLRVTA